jgi:hypothetical protein
MIGMFKKAILSATWFFCWLMLAWLLPADDLVLIPRPDRLQPIPPFSLETQHHLATVNIQNRMAFRKDDLGSFNLNNLRLEGFSLLRYKKNREENQNTGFGRKISKSELSRDSDPVSNPDEPSSPNVTDRSATDSKKYNMYGDLRNDNPAYHKKSPLWAVALKVTMSNVTTWLADRYVFNYDFARIGWKTWKHNIQTGWEWDTDRFGVNYFFHPLSGASFFTAARSSGYSFFESVPFAALGSLEWEYFGENTLPSYNDFINTPVNGTFIGEILYRLSSDILDDRTTGVNRFFRELVAAVVSPSRFFGRLLSGKLTRVTSEEIYQKEPLNLTFSSGYHGINAETPTERTTSSLNFNLHLDYGNPFEERSRKPFDYFKVRMDLDFGVGRKIFDNLTGYGVLFGGNVQAGHLEMLVGLFQHMDFFDNKTFELGTMAFGPGIITRLPMSKRSTLYTNLHVAFVPFAGLSKRFGPDTSQFRDYNYGGGAEAKLESTLNLGGWAGITFVGYYWWFHTYVGDAGNSYIGLIKPSIAFKIYKNIRIGFEHIVYYSDRYPRDFPSVHSVRSEQKIFIQMFFEEFKFK